jgi:hypothetical protein
MLHDTAAQVLAQARAAELRDQARRAALARAPHRTRRARPRRPAYRTPGLLAASPAGAAADLRRRACHSNPSARTK